MPVKVGIVDSGIALAQVASPTTSISFAGTARPAANGDGVGHGTSVAKLVRVLAPMTHLLNAQAFIGGRHADAACVAEAIDWCLEQQARVINLSFGLSADHAALRAACAAAVARGVIVVASSPARGGSVYPAAYAGVLAVSGDARCAAQEWSVIEPGRLVGASTLAADGVTPGGASYAAARMSGHAAHFLVTRPDAGADDFRQWLAAGAAFRGRERRQPEQVA
jgi:subtilisin family serine protease